MMTETLIDADPVELTRRLIRFDTTNPPGAEGDCVRWLAGVLAESGMDVRLLALDPARPNLIARLPGRGLAPPLLLHAHADVVPVHGQNWSVPPFSGVLADDVVWGRGAVDMKGGLAMMAATLLAMRATAERPAGDVILAVVADEEAGSRYGAGYLVGEHPELFAGVQYAIGEDGGASTILGDGRCHPIVVAEKRACWLRLTLRGPGGHGSRPAVPGSPVRQLTRLLQAIETGGLGAEPTPMARLMLAELRKVAAEPEKSVLAELVADPADLAPLDRLPERESCYLRAVLQHSVNATVIHGGEVTNVLPEAITVDLDGRLLPGSFGTQDFVAAIAAIVGPGPEIEVLVEGEPLPEPDLGPFYERMADILRAADQGGIPLPMMSTASTDARLFPKLGITCFGWLPMKFEDGVNYRDLLHAPDERVPADALRFGVRCFAELFRSYR
jgi:acetylornithine deacetylase/succinyl-diaminopimelate desuccinylase-like protein